MGRPPRLSIALWVTALLVGVVAVGWTFLRDDAPARAGLPAVAGALPASSGLGTDGPSGGGPPTDESSRVGDWRVAPAADVFVGYRATEKWAADRFTKTTVGRTGEVEGSLRIDGDRLERVEVEADLGSLRSDQSARDAYLRGDGLETDRFPEARFRLAAPVELPPSAVGEVVELRLDGELTLHGTTRLVPVALQARFSGSSIEVAGAAEVLLTDFGIDPPRTPFIEVDERGELELQLAFVRAASSG